MSIQAEMKAIIKKSVGGSHDTKKTKYHHAENFCQFLKDNNIQLRAAKGIRTKDIKAYVQAQLDAGKSKRTIQNEMSTIRGIMESAGSKLVNNENISNKSLGIAGASRNGTNVAITEDIYLQAKDALLAKGSKAEAAALSLMYTTGLRIKEAVRASQSLESWENKINAGERITVLSGTKGGRIRDVSIFDKEQALTAIKEAQAIAAENNGFLIVGRSNTLESAYDRLENQLRSVLKDTDFTPHSTRYAFAQRQADNYKEDGFSTKDAASAVSLDLGHGSGRGRYVRQVYDQR